MEGATPSPVNDAILLNQIELYFDMGELDDLMFGLGIDGRIAGETVRERARELIGYMQRRQREVDLMAVLQRERPSAKWG